MNQAQPVQTIKFNRVKHYKTKDNSFDRNDKFLLALNNLDFDAVEKMVDQQTIQALDCYTMDQLPKNIKNHLGSTQGATKDVILTSSDKIQTRELTVVHILAFFGMGTSVKKLLQQELSNPSSNYQKQKDQQKFNLSKTNNLNNVDLKIMDYQQYIKHNRTYNILFELNEIYSSGFFDEVLKQKDEPYKNLTRNHIIEFKYNTDGMIRLSFDATQKINCMAFALEQDSVELLDYYWSINYQSNISYQAVLDKLSEYMNDNKSSTKIYPKQVIHYLINHYTIQLYQDFMAIQSSTASEDKKNKALNSLNLIKQNNTLEKMVIKNKDWEALDSLIKNNHNFYEQTNIIYELAQSFMNNKMVDNFTTLFDWIDDYNIDLEKSLAYHLFQNSNLENPNKKQMMMIAFKNTNIKQDFVNECNQKIPNYQSDIEKLKYLKEIGIPIDTKQIEQKIKSSFTKIQNDWQTYRNIATQQCNFVIDNMLLSKDIFKEMDQQLGIVNYFNTIKQEAKKEGKHWQLDEINKFDQKIENFMLKNNLIEHNVHKNNVPNNTNNESKPFKKIL